MPGKQKKPLKRQRKKGPTKTYPLIGLRLSPELMARVDAWVERTEKLVPGLKLTRSAAARTLIEQALDLDEKKRKR